MSYHGARGMAFACARKPIKWGAQAKAFVWVEVPGIRQSPLYFVLLLLKIDPRKPVGWKSCKKRFYAPNVALVLVNYRQQPMAECPPPPLDWTTRDYFAPLGVLSPLSPACVRSSHGPFH